MNAPGEVPEHECEGCGWDGLIGTFKRGLGAPSTEPIYLCEVCYRSPLGIAAELGRPADNSDILEMITLGINMILEEIRKRKNA